MKTDPAAFYWYYEGELCGMFLLQVDGFLWWVGWGWGGGWGWGEIKRVENGVIAQIRNHFQVREQCDTIFRCIELDTVQNKHGATLQQNDNCKSLKSINVNAVRGFNKYMECNDEEKEGLWNLMGQ